MLRAVPMVHVRIQVPARDAGAATRRLARESVLHLVDLAHGAVPGASASLAPAELTASFRDLARRIRHVAARLELPLGEMTGRVPEGDAGDLDREREALEQKVGPIERSVDAAYRARAEASERQQRAREAHARARTLESAGIDAVRLAKLRWADVRIGPCSIEDAESLDAMLGPTPHAIVPLERDGEEWLVAVAVPPSGRETLDAALRVTGARLRPPPPPEKADLAAIEKEIESAREDEEQQAAALASLRPLAAEILPGLLERAEIALVLLQAQACFATAGRFVVIAGWVPAEGAPALAESVREATGGRAVVDLDPPEDVPEVAAGRQRVPILHRNPLLLRPFQRFVGLYGTPSYREIEPTAFFALSFLVMFGLMFGDVGHGLVLFSAGLLLFRHHPRFLDYGILLMEAGVSSTIFGAMYGSLFGIEDVLPALWLRPMHDLDRFLFIAGGLGAVLITIGLILNVVNTWRAGERSRALFGARGLAAAFVYWAGLAIVARAAMPASVVVPTWALVVLAAIPVVLVLSRPLFGRWLERDGHPRARPPHKGPRWLAALEGSVELVDLVFSFFTNTFSFVRVAAFAVVHAGVFLAIFAIADTLATTRFGSVLSVVVVVLGNVIVILLDGLTVSVQVLRLEYYEFFTRFFRGGGEPYRPLTLGPGWKGARHEQEAQELDGGPRDRRGGAAARSPGDVPVGVR